MLQPGLRTRLVASVTRRYPLMSGCGTFANSPWIRRMAGPSNDTPAWTKLRRGGGRLLVPLSDYVGRAAYFTGDLDPKVSWIVRKLVRPGDTVLDIGANLGLVTLQLASLVGPTGRVHAFEPNPRLISLLRQSLKRNQLDQVTLHDCALGAQPGELTLSFPAGNAGQGSLCHEREGWQGVPVTVRTLDEVAAQEGFEQVRFLKIDVEGFEASVFAGGAAWMERHPPKAILFEHNVGAGPIRKAETVRILQGLGYRFFGLPRRILPWRMRVSELASTGGEATSGGTDVLAVQAGEATQLLRGLASRLAASQ